MFTKINISLTIPKADKPDRSFSLKLKQHLYNEPSVFTQAPKIFVVSDIEGNFQSLCRLLMKSGVIDRYFKWTFGEGHLVILGDCFDRGEQVTECLWLIYSLEEKARKRGGYVHFILGNHEIMNMNGDWRYVHPNYASRTKTNTALYDANNELWRWLRTKNIVEKIGQILLVHAGISSALLNVDCSLAEINAAVRPYYTRANETFSTPLLNIIFNSELSPFWYRGYYEDAVETLVDATLNKFGVTTIVTGHTVMPVISRYYNGKVINVDTDHASANSEGLLIVNKRSYTIDRTGRKKLLSK